jgi:ubiquinone/menaquinone biosynthesis C-methylase UbiE
MKELQIKEAYRSSKNIYDDTLTQSKWWSRFYISFFWGGVNDIYIAERVLESIPLDFGGKLLDVPVGTAVFTAKKYKSLPDADITCLDYSEDMLLQARERFSKDKNINCVQGDAGNLQFENEAFDIVLSMNGFHAFPDKKNAFSETCRVLKKDGTFCGCFYIRGQNRRTDFIVNSFLAKKGWFTPPFQTLEQLKSELERLYTTVELSHNKSMAYFRCTK